VCADCDRYGELRQMGCINESVRYKQRFFVPSKKEKGIPLLRTLLERYPVVEDGRAPTQEERLPLVDRPAAAEAEVIELEKWVLPPERHDDHEVFDLLADLTIESAEDQNASADEFAPTLPDLFSIIPARPTLEAMLEERTRVSHARSRRRPRHVIEGQNTFAF